MGKQSQSSGQERRGVAVSEQRTEAGGSSPKRKSWKQGQAWDKSRGRPVCRKSYAEEDEKNQALRFETFQSEGAEREALEIKSRVEKEMT